MAARVEVLELAAGECPSYPAEAAERYVMRWMPPEEARRFERHMNHCAGCVQAVSEMQMFAGILKAALAEACTR